MRERHERDALKTNEKLERQLMAEEEQALESVESERERKLRELKDRQAAELAARSKEMSQEEVQQVCSLGSPGGEKISGWVGREGRKK